VTSGQPSSRWVLPLGLAAGVLVALACERAASVGGDLPPAQQWPLGMAPCEASNAEICNQWDDDCDGQIDEAADGGSVCDDPCRVVQVQRSCALRADGQLYCWGDGTGSGTRFRAYSPVRVPIAEPVVQSSQPCARTMSGLGVCWGWSSFPQIEGVLDQIPTAIDALGSTVAYLVAGRRYNGGTMRSLFTNGPGTDAPLRCALRSGTWQGSLWCWPWDPARQLVSESPRQIVAIGGQVEQVALGITICARKADGSVWCAPDVKSWHQLAPVSELGTDNVDVAVADHVCALKRTGEAVCLGPPICQPPGDWNWKICESRNVYGELATGSTTPATTPTVSAAALGNDLVKLALDVGVTCALTRTGAVRCVGGRRLSVEQRDMFDPSPYVPVGLEQEVVDLAPGCAVKRDGSLWCWGIMPGDGTLGRAIEPVRIDVCPERAL
jgi:hypothetical protein